MEMYTVQWVNNPVAHIKPSEPYPKGVHYKIIIMCYRYQRNKIRRMDYKNSPHRP